VGYAPQYAAGAASVDRAVLCCAGRHMCPAWCMRAVTDEHSLYTIQYNTIHIHSYIINYLACTLVDSAHLIARERRRVPEKKKQRHGDELLYLFRHVRIY